jgi:GNAT superfamily N-acetyltransferase
VTAGPASLEVVLRLSVELSPAALAELFDAAWPDSAGPRGAELEHSLCWVSAHVGERLVGFVNVAWDGGVHAFLLDATVHPEFQRRGIGVSLVRCAADEASELGAEWLHVDYEPRHAEFYRRCGFQPTAAGLLNLKGSPAQPLARPAPALRKYASTDAAACRSLMAGLGNWFGIATAAEAYLADLARLPTWVAVLDGSVVGFVSVTRSAPRTFEVHVLAVAAERHGQGVGRALMRQAERWALTLGARFMQVKTLGPSHADPHYAKTRAFYLRIGYEPLLETDRFWGEGNPTLLLVKAIG